MKTLLICHEEDRINREALARWLASFSDLCGILVLRETDGRKRKRVKRELKRVGPLRMLDVLAFRAYYRAFLQSGDAAWEADLLNQIASTYPPVPEDTPTLVSTTVNTKASEQFIAACAPDIVIARCKQLMKQSVFEIARTGTFVMHPGVCPEYRNAHGCFWALAMGDDDKVGMSLLKIDRGVDTGPVFGYFYYRDDGKTRSHIQIQHRVVFDHLDAIEEKLKQIQAGDAERIDTRGRPSNEWGQPWLTKYLAWRRRSKRKRVTA